MSSFDTLITEFLEYLEIEKNRSQLTIRNYDHYLRVFLAWSKVASISQVNFNLIRKYRLYLNHYRDEKGQALKSVTQSYYIIALRSFLKYLAKRDIKTMAAEKLELPKISERTIEFLEPNELDKLLSQPNIHNLNGLRDRTILETLFSTGLRVSELVSLNRDSISLLHDEFTVRGKGDKPRVVFLSTAAKSWLSSYLKQRKDNLKPLFINHPKQASKNSEKEITDLNANRLTPRSIQRIVKKYALLAGITKNVTPHTLRHSFATDLLRNDADIRSVQAMLGHSNITTTQVYTHVTDRGLREIHKKCHHRK